MRNYKQTLNPFIEFLKYQHARQQVTETASRQNVNLNFFDLFQSLFTRISMIEFVLMTERVILDKRSVQGACRTRQTEELLALSKSETQYRQ